MSFNTEIFSAKLFLKRLKTLHKKYPSLKQDIEELKKILAVNPRIGTSLGQNAYKISLKITSKGKGKSGGARIISHVETGIIGIVKNNRVNLLTIYDKSELDSIDATQIASLIKNMEF